MASTASSVKRESQPGNPPTTDTRVRTRTVAKAGGQGDRKEKSATFHASPTGELPGQGTSRAAKIGKGRTRDLKKNGFAESQIGQWPPPNAWAQDEQHATSQKMTVRHSHTA
eukprot:4119249-Amphidinium_carterae.1